MKKITNRDDFEDEIEEEIISNQPRTSYNGNPNLKPVDIQFEFTQEQVQEIIKCKRDPIYFIETYCKIVSLDEGLIPFKPWDCQKKFIRLVLKERKVIVRMGRQFGKTTCAAAAILYYSLFNENKTISILANKSSAAREVLDRYQIMYESLPIWLQQGVKTWNKGNVELENGCKIFTAATTSSATRGKSVNWLYIDEAAMIPNNVAEQFFTSVYPTISSGKTTKILITSTPMGYNYYWKFWNEAEKGNNGFVPLFIHYSEIPGRDENWAEEQRAVLGELKFNQEFLCVFLGSSKTLISAKTLEQLSSKEPIVDKQGLRIYTAPIKGRIYMIVVDVSQGVGGDYSAFTVIDITELPYTLVATYRDNTISPMLYPNIIHKVAKDFNNAFVLVELNDMGGQITNILSQDLEYENLLWTTVTNTETMLTAGFGGGGNIGVKTSKKVKRQGCFAAKNLIEEKQLLVFDADLISEMSTFIERNGSYKADEGYYDDLMITVVLFGWATTNEFFKELTNVDVRSGLYAKQMLNIEEDLTPFGFQDDPLAEEVEVIDGDLWLTQFTMDDNWTGPPTGNGW